MQAVIYHLEPHIRGRGAQQWLAVQEAGAGDEGGASDVSLLLQSHSDQTLELSGGRGDHEPQHAVIDPVFICLIIE